MAEVIDLAGRRIMTGLIVAGGVIGIGLYAQPGPARYQIVSTGTGIARLNTKSGYVTTCEGGHCYRTLRPGSQDIERRPKAAQVPAPTARPALQPPPQGAPTSAAQPDAAARPQTQPAPATR
jgi:hypothetical protein